MWWFLAAVLSVQIILLVLEQTTLSGVQCFICNLDICAFKKFCVVYARFPLYMKVAHVFLEGSAL